MTDNAYNRRDPAKPFPHFPIQEDCIVIFGELTIGVIGLVLTYHLVAQFVSRRELASRDLDYKTEMQSVLSREAEARDRLVKRRPSDFGWKGWRDVQVMDVRDESPDCRSFRFGPLDGSRGHDKILPRFRGGQSILVSMRDAQTGKRVSRCYSLSGGPDEPHYRITVKRVPGGKVSNWLHDHLRVGDHIQIQQPRGSFHVNELHADQPLVLIAAGIGITPMLSMLLENLEQTPKRRVALFYQLRSNDNAPFLKALRQLVSRVSRLLPVTLHVFYSKPSPDQKLDVNDQLGRVDAERMLEQLGGTAGEFMICGPGVFMESIAEGLVAHNVDADRVHYESFGGKAKGVGAIAVKNESPGDQASYEIAFAGHDADDESQVTQWDGTDGSLLDFAENQDIEVESACRVGNCGACVCKLRSGTVAYATPPDFEAESDEVVMCVARPTSNVVIELLT
ncbi:2Fe-2S iron-sulfur cluster-binding protein [Neorhodopirellula lusitana]|uniref:2Fe-2S iron-sulfur cluster-binding protein n=1 Tax=Neorhodopirellula lusitana TaxID=445327 RepID=UPI0038503454